MKFLLTLGRTLFAFILLHFSISVLANVQRDLYRDQNNFQNIIHWQLYDKMPKALSNTAVVSYNSLIYLVGGNNELGATQYFWSYDPYNKQWQQLADMQTPRFAHGMVLGDEKIYVFGGMQVIDGKNQYLDSIEVYDFRENKWSNFGQMPIPLARFGIAKIDDNIFIAGGCNQENAAIDSFLVFNVRTKTWRSLPYLPQAVSRNTVIVWQNQTYIIGGADESGNALAKMWSFSSKSNQWTPGPHLNTERKNFASAIFEEDLYITGGWRTINETTQFIPSTESLSANETSWEIAGELPLGKDGVRMLNFENRLYLFGGFNQEVSAEVLSGTIEN